MKAKNIFLILIGLAFISNVKTANANPKIDEIKLRNKIICGTDLSHKGFAYKDEEGNWQGIDAKLCRLFATAIFNDGNKYELKDIKTEEIKDVLKNDKIDIMLGATPWIASNEILKDISFTKTTYLSKQSFVAKYKKDASSMSAYKKSNVCVNKFSSDLRDLIQFNSKYDLQFNIIPQAGTNKNVEAFLLNRCNMIFGNEILLKSKLTDNNLMKKDIILLPEKIGETPIAPAVSNKYPKFANSIKWVINAIILADKYNINEHNINSYFVSNDLEMKNLTGNNKRLWEKLDLHPDWFKTAIIEIGNYETLYKNTIGKDSYLEIEVENNKPTSKGGKLSSEPFL